MRVSLRCDVPCSWRPCFIPLKDNRTDARRGTIGKAKMMTQLSDHYRLAFTIFDDREPLWRSMLTIIEAGLKIDQLCLIAPASTVTHFMPFASAAGGQFDRLVELFKNMHEWTSPFGGQKLVTTSEPISELILSASTGPPGKQHGSSPQSDILNQVRQGNIALVVASSDPKQQLMVTRTLLGVSSHRVTTFEFSVPDQRVRDRSN